MTDSIRTAICAAADWLEANPRQHIQANLAKTKRTGGRSVPPTDPEATCFCMVGRIAKELADAGVAPKGMNSYGVVGKALEEAKIDLATYHIWNTNDSDKAEAIRLVKEKASC